MTNKKNNRVFYSRIAKQYNFDPRPIKRNYNLKNENPTVNEEVVKAIFFLPKGDADIFLD